MERTIQWIRFHFTDHFRAFHLQSENLQSEKFQRRIVIDFFLLLWIFFFKCRKNCQMQGAASRTCFKNFHAVGIMDYWINKRYFFWLLLIVFCTRQKSPEFLKAHTEKCRTVWMAFFFQAFFFRIIALASKEVFNDAKITKLTELKYNALYW